MSRTALPPSAFFLLSSAVWAPLWLGGDALWAFSLSVLLLAAAIAMSPSGLPRTAADPWMLVFAAALLGCAAFSRVPCRTAPEVFKALSCVGAVYAAAAFCRGRSEVKLLSGTMVALGAALSFFGLFQYLGALPHPWWHKARFLSSTYVNHNHFAGLLEIALPLGLALSLADRSTAKRVLWAFLSIVMALALAFSQSRGGWISVGAGLFLFIWVTVRSRVFGASAVVLPLLLLGAAAVVHLFGQEEVVSRISSMRHVDIQDESTRPILWKAAWRIFESSPWTGSGPGTFDLAFLRHRLPGFSGRAGHAHNDYLELLSDCGLLVFLAVAVLWLVLLWRGSRAVGVEDSRLRVGVVGACLAAWVSLATHSLVDYNFHIPGNAFLAALTAGMMLSFDVKTRAGEASSSRWAARALASALASAALYFGLSDRLSEESGLRQRRGDAEGATSAGRLACRIRPDDDIARYRLGLALESSREYAEAAEQFQRASELNPLEPYYLFNLAKNRVLAEGRIKEVLPLFTKAAAADPSGAAVHHLCAKEVLEANRSKDVHVERAAVALMARSVRMDPSYALRAHRELWRYSRSLALQQDLLFAAPEGYPGFLLFLRSIDAWSVHRRYLLYGAGRDPDRIRKEIASTAWDEGSKLAVSGEALESVPDGQRTFRNKHFIYARGAVRANVALSAGRTLLRVEAKGSRARGAYPYLLVHLDGRLMDAIYVESLDLKEFTAMVETSEAGEHEIKFTFANDLVRGKEDRNLWIERVTFQPQA